MSEEPEMSAEERREADAMGAELAGRRARMAPGLRLALGRAVGGEATRRRIRARPRHLWPLITATSVVGAVLLAVAVAQI